MNTGYTVFEKKSKSILQLNLNIAFSNPTRKGRFLEIRLCKFGLYLCILHSSNIYSFLKTI